MPANMPALSPATAFVVGCIFLLIIASIVSSWIWVILKIAFREPVLPPSTPRVVPWGAGSVLAAIVAYFAVMILVIDAYVLAIRPGPPAGAGKSPDFTPFEMMGLSAAYNLGTLIVVPLTLALTARARPRDFGLATDAPGRQFTLGMMAYPLLAPLIFGMMIVSSLIWKPDTHPLAKAMMDQLTPSMGVILAVAGAVLAPMAEELMFRGVLLGWLTRIALGRKPSMDRELLDVEPPPPLVELESRTELVGEPMAFEPGEGPYNLYSAPLASITTSIPFADHGVEAFENLRRSRALLAANVAVSLVFAGMHYKVWPTPIPIFFLSLGLGFLYQRTGGLIAPVALHMTFNGISTLLMFVSLGAAPKAPNPIPPPAARAIILAPEMTR